VTLEVGNQWWIASEHLARPILVDEADPSVSVKQGPVSGEHRRSHDASAGRT